MRLFIPLAFKVTLILFIGGSDGLMFNAWLRSGSTTERHLPAPGQYKYQTYANNDAQIAASVPYESKKDLGKPNVDAEMAAAAITPSRAFYGPSDKETVAAYNNQRTGISAPPKYDKHWNVFDAVVVHSIPATAVVPSTPITYVAIPAQNYPYFYYRDSAKAQQHTQNSAAAASFTTTPSPSPTPTPQKSVQVELNYKDDTVVEKIGENVVLHRKIPAPTDTAESIQATSESPALVVSTGTSSGNSTNASTAINSSSPLPPIQRQNFASFSYAPESAAKWNLQNRPIKLLGSNAFYASPANFTFPPQLYYAPAPAPAPALAPDIHYFPYPFLKSPLVAPFLYRNVPRAVSERSEIVPPSPSPPQLATIQFTNNNKSEKPICDNCPSPAHFSTYSHALKFFDANGNGNIALQKPCAQENASTSPTSSTLKPSNFANFAYVLVPSQLIENRPSRKR